MAKKPEAVTVSPTKKIVVQFELEIMSDRQLHAQKKRFDGNAAMEHHEAAPVLERIRDAMKLHAADFPIPADVNQNALARYLLQKLAAAVLAAEAEGT